MLDSLDNLIPSKVENEKILRRNLKWSSRIAYAWNFIFLILFKSISIDALATNQFLVVALTLTSIQACFCLYALQSYRRLFAISSTLRDKAGLKIAFAFWLIIMLLFNFWQIIFGQAAMLSDVWFWQYSLIIWVVLVILGIFGEVLLKRIYIK